MYMYHYAVRMSDKLVQEQVSTGVKGVFKGGGVWGVQTPLKFSDFF